MEKNQVYAEFVSSLFSILYEVYNSSAGSVIKHRSLRAILSMNYYSNSNNNNNNDDENVLHNLLKTLPISSHIASMLASTDPKIIVSALQICEILMQKMPDVFSVYFHREGVIHQIDKLIESSSVALAKSAAQNTEAINKADQSNMETETSKSTTD